MGYYIRFLIYKFLKASRMRFVLKGLRGGSVN
jgi:hypothetical protein